MSAPERAEELSQAVLVTPCRPSMVMTMIQRAMDASTIQEVGTHPVLLKGIGRTPKPSHQERIYFWLEDPLQPTVKLRAWVPGKLAPQWNKVIVVQAFIRVQLTSTGNSLEPLLEILACQETVEVASTRDTLRERFASAFTQEKRPIQSVFFKDKPRVVLLTSQGGEADRDIMSQLAGYEALFVKELIPVKMMDPGSVAKALEEQQARVGQVDMVIVARGGGEGIGVLDHETILFAASKRTLPLVTAIGHARDSTLLDEVADRAFPSPTALGAWLREQLEAKAKGHEDARRLAGLELEKEYLKLKGLYESLKLTSEKAQGTWTEKLQEVEKGRLLDRETVVRLEEGLKSERSLRTQAETVAAEEKQRWMRVAMFAVGLALLMGYLWLRS